MKIKSFFYICLFTIFSFVKGFSSSDFLNDLKHEDPDSVNLNSSFEESIKLHQTYLDRAITSADTLNQIYGLIYLHNDYIKNINYKEAGKCILQAESLAQKAKNNYWLGWINHKKGALNVQLRDFPLAIKYYTKSIEYCKKATDSLCLAFNYEQLCSMHSQLKNYDSAHYYFSLAEPLLEAYADKDAQSVALINYGSLLVYQDRDEEAIPYFKKASKLCIDLKNSYRAAQCDQNLAVAYVNTGKYGIASEIFTDLIKKNKENNRPERLFYNYYGIYQMYSQMGNHREALNYYIKFHKLRDSVITENTKIQISDLESKFDLERQTQLLSLNKSILKTTQLTLHRRTLLFSILIIVVLGIILVLYSKTKLSNEKLKLKHKNLESLTSLLIKKNKDLVELDEELTKLRNVDESTISTKNNTDNLYNNRILTDSDWMTFKASFEELYPGYIQKVNQHHKNISEGEQRLFLLLKLGLKTKEVSAILGISVDSVKKSRYRLRKRLILKEEESLEDYVTHF